MANEATLLVQQELPLNFTVDNSTGIAKGALCGLTDPNTAILASANGQMISGIAATEKIASDGVVSLALHRKGVFKLLLSGAVTAGEAVSSGAVTTPNTIIRAPVTVSGSAVLGQALETGADGETIRVAVNIGCGGNQVS